MPDSGREMRSFKNQNMRAGEFCPGPNIEGKESSYNVRRSNIIEVSSMVVGNIESFRCKTRVRVRAVSDRHRGNTNCSAGIEE